MTGSFSCPVGTNVEIASSAGMRLGWYSYLRNWASCCSVIVGPATKKLVTAEADLGDDSKVEIELHAAIAALSRGVNELLMSCPWWRERECRAIYALNSGKGVTGTKAVRCLATLSMTYDSSDAVPHEVDLGRGVEPGGH